MTLMIIQLLIVLLALYVGSRYGSLALGAISGIGLAILVLGFGLQPGKPPTDVIYIIIAAVTCAGIMQASGGMDWLIQIAERLLRKHPNHIIILAPLCTFFLTVLVGTGHVVYTLMPIICDISLKKGIRPERPCAVASVASQVGITCSPIAAAVASFVVISNAHGFNINNLQVIAITIPACICGLMAAALVSYKRGLDLDKDPAFQARLKDPQMKEYMYGNTASVLDKEVSKEAKRAVFIFLGALAVIVFFSIMQIAGHDIRPKFPTGKVIDGVAQMKPLAMNIIIQIVMITAAAFMIICCKASPKKAVAGAVWQSGMVAVVAIYGIAWLADTYFANYMDVMQGGLKDIVQHYPWAIAFAFFAVSVLINSQGAVVVAMLPLAYSLGIEGPVLLGVLPSVYGYFFIPNYPSDIATVNFDRSGTTVIGKYLLNHSFMRPGLVSVIVSTIVGTLLVKVFY
ncbi:MAG: anaerobic C4-dicarboxylate transporter [Fibrobacter sp.]|nr:anaerobic C4-dicarboxylate transporter [Fibrobacter sp.]